MEHSQKSGHKPGGAIDRLRSAVADSIYVGIVNVLLTIVLLQFPIPPMVITGLTFAVYLSYAVYLTVNHGRTIGKQAFGLPVVGVLFYVANGLTVVLSKEKRGWHDLAAGTQVLKTGEQWGTGKQFLYIMLPLFVLGFLVLHLYSLPEFLRLSGTGQ